MTASSAIGDVTQTLQELLEDAQQPANTFDVTLVSPADETVDSLRPKVNLFLYRVMENAFAKNQDWQAVGTGILQKPPLTLNLFYMLTPFAEDKLDEQRVFGEAMRILYDHAIVAAPLLRGALEHSAEELKVDLRNFDLEELTRIWNALAQPYRLSVCYEVRIVLIDSASERSVQRVLVKEERYS